MRMPARAWSVGSLLLLSLAACGGGAPDAATPVTPAAGSADAGGADAAATAPVSPAFAKAASPDLQAHWPFTAATKPDVTVYIDVDGLLKTDLVQQYALPILVPLMATQVSPEAQSCEKGLVSHARELAIGSTEGAVFSVLRVDADSAKATLASCVAVSRSKMTTLAMPGADEAWSMDDGDVTARKGGFIASGPKDLVLASITSAVSPSTYPAAALGLATNQYVAASIDRNEMTGRVALVAASDKFKVSLEADVPDERFAKGFEAKMLEQKNQADDPDATVEARAMVATLKKSLLVKRDGKHLSFALELDEAPNDQAKDLTTFALYGVKTYIASTKEIEARLTVTQIAKDYLLYEQKLLEVAKTTPKLMSLPAVPKTVPRGQKYQSSEKEWKAWQPIGFSLIEAQFYQYEVKAAKDGKSADVIAHGDLNGDGKVSTFKVTVTLDPATKQFSVSDQIAEDHPDE